MPGQLLRLRKPGRPLLFQAPQLPIHSHHTLGQQVSLASHALSLCAQARELFPRLCKLLLQLFQAAQLFSLHGAAAKTALFRLNGRFQLGQLFRELLHALLDALVVLGI